MNYDEVLARVPSKLAQTVTIQGPGTTDAGKLLFGCGTARAVGEQAALLGAGKVLVITDKTIVALGLHREILSALKARGIEISVYDDVPPEPHMDTMRFVEARLRQEPVEVVIGLGGGSAMDVAKLAACLARTKDSARQLMQDSALITGRIPSLLIPTTAGTGSEVSPYVVVSDEGKKKFISSPYLYASVALVDPLLTLTMPPKVTATTGLDALSHGVEGVCGMTNPYTLGLAAQCVELAFRYLPIATQDGDNIEARYHMSFASVLGMLTYAQGGGLYAHSASYVITTEKGLPHGLGCGLALPYTLAYNKPAIPDILSRFGCAINRSGFGQVGDATQTIEAFLRLVKAVQMPTTLQEIGYAAPDIDGFARKMLAEYPRPKNPVELDGEAAKALVAAMHQGVLPLKSVPASGAYQLVCNP